MVFLHYSTSIVLKLEGLKHILGMEGGDGCSELLIKSLMELYQNCQHSFAVVHIRAQEIDSSQISG